MADGSVIIDTEIDQSGLKTGLAKMAGDVSKGLAVAIAAAATAATALVQQAVKAYADYEQLVGGVATLFKDNAATVEEYAANAYKTAGLSANEYMRNVTSFSASLLQGLGGDTAAAAEVADLAITDMADNANKMGTSIGSIQEAYQGFAKQNYTMLDNLKLGYGGTKEEMERLIADANTLKEAQGGAADLTIENFADIIEAVHLVQNEMGITGTTAAEASETIQGSASMMQAAWANMLVGIADDSADFDTLVSNLAGSAATFIENIIPRIEIALGGVAQLIEMALPMAFEEIPEIIADVLPCLVETAGELVTGFAGAVIDALPTLLSVGIQAVTTLINGISEALPTLIPAAVNAVLSIVKGLASGLPQLIKSGLSLISALTDGVIKAIPVIAAALPQIIDALVSGLLESIPAIILAGVQLLTSLVENLPQIITGIVSALPKIITSIVNAIVNNIGLIAQAGVQLLVALVKNIPAITAQLVAAIPQLINALISGIVGSIPQMVQAGFNLLSGLGQGIGNAIGSVVARAREAAQMVISSVKGFFGIASPSKLFRDVIGENLMLGWAEGIEENTSAAVNAMKDATKNVTAAASFDDIITDAQATITGVKIASGQVKTGGDVQAPGYGNSTVIGDIVVNLYGDVSDEEEAKEIGEDIASEISKQLRYRGIFTVPSAGGRFRGY